ncbi:MAG: CheR family methyltransferase [Candidatus Zixiibacteriota bacterium]
MIREAMSLLKRLPLIRGITQSHWWKSVRYRLLQSYGDRKNEVFTRFLRAGRQFDALAGPVTDHIIATFGDGTIKIVVLGCSTGAEAYSIASTLLSKRPEISFSVRGFDIDNDVIAQARSARYSDEEIAASDCVDRTFIDATFDREDGGYRVKPAVADIVSFDKADLFDHDVGKVVGMPDILFVQNVLLNFRPKDQVRAFRNIMTLLKPGAVLFIDGMDLHLRTRLTRSFGLSPLEYRIEEIHNDARLERGCGWPYNYWGLELFSAKRKDWVRRYATIFIRLQG